MNTFKQKIDKQLQNTKGEIYVIGHLSPDDDCVSSILILNYFLKTVLKVNNKINLVLEDIGGERWDYFLKNLKHSYNQEILFNFSVGENIKDKDTLIILDAKHYKRVFKDYDFIKAKDITTICIDHHTSQVKEEKYNLLLTYPQVKYSSNAELLFDLLLKESLKNLNPYICEVILLGILYDTSNLRYANSKTINTVSKIVGQGKVDIDKLQQKYLVNSINELKVFAEYIKNTKFIDNTKFPPFSYSLLEKEDCGMYNEQELIEGRTLYKNFTKQIKGAKWGFFVKPENDNFYSISFRSGSEGPNVKIISESFDFGGGHDRKAGVKLKAKSCKEVVEKVFEYLKNNEPVIL